MIAQVELGTGFKGEVEYLMCGHLDSLDPDRVAWTETRNLPTDDPRAAARIMAATARDSMSRQAPVYHVSVSFDYGDPDDRRTMRRVADRLLRDLRLQGHQVVIVAHRDRAHAHLHLVVNRVHPEELKVWSTWKDYWRIERSLRAQEVELGMRVVPGWVFPVFDAQGKRLWPARLVRGDREFLDRVRLEAGPHLAGARSWAELERALAEHGLTVKMKGRGMVVTDGRHEVKASEIDRAFSRARLEARMGIHGEYRLRQHLAARTLDERAERVAQTKAQERTLEEPALAPTADAPRIWAALAEPAAPTAPNTPGTRRPAARPQFGDAGHGIVELFGQAPELRQPDAPARGPQPERSAPAVAPGPTSHPERGDAAFLREVRERAGPVLEAAGSWQEVESGLAEHGLSLRATGGGFTVTDGAREVKASEVGRAFSRFHLEKRLGGYPDDRARTAAAGIAPAPPASPVQPEALAQRQEQDSPLSPPPSSAPPAEAPGPEHHVRAGRRPQLGDAGHGIAELFGYAQPLERGERPGTVEERVPAPQPELAPPPVPSLATAAGVGLSGDAPAAQLPELPREPVPELTVQAPQAEPIEPHVAVPVEPPTPARARRRQVEFLGEVKERASTVLERAGSWAELERGLVDLGLSLREKGGGFVVTDGELEVKASDAGRAFSRFHLEKRLGRYPDSRAREAVDEIKPVQPVPVEPDVAVRQPEQLPLPLPAPAVQEGEQGRTQERSAASRGSVRPAREGIEHGSPPLPPPSREAPAPAAAPTDRARTWAPEPVMQPPRSQPVERPTPKPSVRVEEPRSPASPPARRMEPPLLRQPVRPSEPQVPPTERTRPLTERERYRIVLGAFKAELAPLYRDPRAARDAFAASLVESSPEAAARALEANPARFGRLRWGADLRRVTETARWAELYARWQVEGTRLDARHAAARFRRAFTVDAAEAALRDAREAFHQVAGGPSSLARRERSANEGERTVERRLRGIYDRPAHARELMGEYLRAHGQYALERELRDSPERFGELRAEWRSVLGIPLRRDTSRARSDAKGWAPHLAGALNAIAARPTREEHARADEALRAAQAKVDAARSTRDALGPASAKHLVREALLSLHVADRGSADRARRLDRQVTSMLPAGAVQLVRKLMHEIAREQEREHAREQSRGRGLDIT